MAETTGARRSLFDIDAELDGIATAIDLLEEGGEEEAVTAVVEAYFGDLLDERDAKVDRYVGLIRKREATAALRKAEAALYAQEAERIRNLSKTDESTVKRLKNLLLRFMKAKCLKRIETTTNKLWLQKNGGKRTVKLLPGADPQQVHDAWGGYVTLEYSFDTDAIRDELLRIEGFIAEQLAAARGRMEDAGIPEEAIAEALVEQERELREQHGLPFAELGEVGEGVRFA